MHKHTLSEYKINLENQQRNLAERLYSLKRDKNRNIITISTNIDDQSQRIENIQVIKQLEVLEKNKLENVKTALRRIEEGSFAKCIICKEEISQTRMKAIPFASRCINCC
jgi:RNA polymerase-binding transcription factor DksA